MKWAFHGLDFVIGPFSQLLSSGVFQKKTSFGKNTLFHDRFFSGFRFREWVVTWVGRKIRISATPQPLFGKPGPNGDIFLVRSQFITKKTQFSKCKPRQGYSGKVTLHPIIAQTISHLWKWVSVLLCSLWSDVFQPGGGEGQNDGNFGVI